MELNAGVLMRWVGHGWILACGLLLVVLGPAAKSVRADEKDGVRLFRPLPAAHYTDERIDWLKGRATYERGESLEWQSLDLAAVRRVVRLRRFTLFLETPERKIQPFEMFFRCGCMPKIIVFHAKLEDGTMAFASFAWEDTPEGRRYAVHALVHQGRQYVEYRATPLPYQKGSLYLRRQMPMPVLLPGKDDPTRPRPTPSTTPVDGGPIKPGDLPERRRRVDRWPWRRLEDDGSRIDLLVGYTKDVEEKEGGDILGLRSAIGTSVCAFNTALSWSKTETQVCLRDVVPVDYREETKDHEEILAEVDDDPGLQAARVQWKADVVCVIAMNLNSPYTGHAWIWRSTSGSFAPRAYSMAKWANAGDGFVLAHEISHNFGCQHAEGGDDGLGALANYAHGWAYPCIDANGEQRMNATVHGAGGTATLGVVLTPRLVFSNPNVLDTVCQPSAAVGVALAKNAEIIRSHRKTIANWGNYLTPSP